MRRTVAFGLLLTMLAASQFAVGEASAEKPNIQGSSTQAQVKKNCDANGGVYSDTNASYGCENPNGVINCDKKTNKCIADYFTCNPLAPPKRSFRQVLRGTSGARH
jgi:hypothetical protein